jgi:hypothetical protein
MMGFGEVLYPYRKLKLMEETREERAAMALAARAEALEAALRGFEGQLQRIWNDPTHSAAERRAILFALWDECAESGPDEIVSTARSIRAIILSFVRRELPRGSALAYGDDELSALNAVRSSRALFAPY